APSVRSGAASARPMHRVANLCPWNRDPAPRRASGGQRVRRAFVDRLGAWYVELRGRGIATGWRPQEPGVRIDLARGYVRGHRPVWRRGLAAVHLGHERRPRRRGENAALCVGFDRLRMIESHPDAGDEVRCVAHEPDVGAVVGSAGLAARGNVKAGVPNGAVSSTALHHVLHHADHQPRFFGRHHLRARLCRLPDHLMVRVLDAQNSRWLRADAERRERGVCADQLNRNHLSRSDVDRWIRRDRRGDSKISRFVDHRLWAKLHAGLDGDDVAGLIQASPHRHGALELEIVVLRLPRRSISLRNRYRRIVDDVRRWLASLDRRRVDDRFERRARLPQRLRCTIELGVVEVAAADHCAYTTGARIERDECSLQVRRYSRPRFSGGELCDVGLVARMLVRAVSPALDRAKLPLQRAFGGGLHVEIERGVDVETLRVDLVAELLIQLLPNPLDEIRRGLARLDLGGEAQRICLCETSVGVRNGAVLAHQLDDRVASLNRAIGIPARIVALGRLGERGQRCGFGDVQVAYRFAEVSLRRRLDSVCTVAEVDLIEIQLENLLLAVLGFDLARYLGFLDLPDDRLVARDALGEDVSRELHRYGRESLGVAATPHVVDERADGAIPVDAGMLVEALVFGDDEGVLQDLGDVTQLHQRAALGTELRDEAPIDGVELG